MEDLVRKPNPRVIEDLVTNTTGMEDLMRNTTLIKKDLVRNLTVMEHLMRNPN